MTAEVKDESKVDQSPASDYEAAVGTLRLICQIGNSDQKLRAAELLLHATGYLR